MGIRGKGGGFDWIGALLLGVFALLGLSIAALFAFAPVEHLEPFFEGRRGLPRSLLESARGILWMRTGGVAFGLLVGGLAARGLWILWRKR